MMDSHCFWLGQCVGLHNKKYHVLLLTYTLWFALSVAAC
jgi:hypothetical protein